MSRRPALYIFLLFLFLVSTFLFISSYSRGNEVLSVNPNLYIGDYIFCVEEAIGDRYNVRIRYSLKRQDGGLIEPTVRFESLHSNDYLFRTYGGSSQYDLSEDGKTIWIVEDQSSSQTYDSKSLHTVVLENLKFGENSNLKPLKGTWSATFRIQIDESYRELLQHDLEVPISDSKNIYAQISTVQLSTMGIHMEMRLPNNDISNLANDFTVFLLLKNGSVIELELNHSIHGKRSPFSASSTGIFKESLVLDEIKSVIVCGLEIPLSSQ